MRRLRIFLFAVLLLSLAVSCDAKGASESAPSLCIASWNVQNLFDAKLDGSEYEEYKPSSGWTEDAYKTRLSNAAKVLGYLPSARSHIFILNEIENPNVVEDLINICDSDNLGLRFYACAGESGGAIQTTVLSNLPISGARIHDVEVGLRPVLEVEFDTPSGKVFVLAVHFKSNIGGIAETAEKRRRSAMVVDEVSNQIQTENPGCIVLVCGDMNEECWDGNAMGREAEGSAPLKVGSTFQRGFWHCFWLDLSLGLWPSGSYMYDGVWRCYDNILVSQTGKDGSGWEFSSCGVVFKGILQTADMKINAWDRSLLRGVSDHLPVWVMFETLN